MTHRQRVLAAMMRRQPDRVPLDLGGTTASTLTLGACNRLRRHLGLPGDPPPALISPRNATVFPDDAMISRFSLDCRLVVPGNPFQRPERPLAGGKLIDAWGVVWVKPGDGHYIPVDGPLQRIDDPQSADLDAIAWPDPSDPGWIDGLRSRAQRCSEAGSRAVVLGLAAGPVHQCQFMRGYAEWLQDLLVCPAFAEALMDRIVDIWIEIAERALGAAGEFVDIVTFSDDIATQMGPLFRPDLYRRLIKPRHRRMVEALKRHGKPMLYHSCGSPVAFIPDLIEIGVDALNPIQVSAAHMDTRVLKREFGKDLCFWGGIDTQRVLPAGTPLEVRDEVRRRIDDLAAGGGFVLAAVHNIQPDVPPENVVAMLEAGLEYGSAR